MKAILYIGLFGAAIYGCMKLGTWLANRNRKEEPINNDEDQSDNYFL